MFSSPFKCKSYESSLKIFELNTASLKRLVSVRIIKLRPAHVVDRSELQICMISTATFS